MYTINPVGLYIVQSTHCHRVVNINYLTFHLYQLAHTSHIYINNFILRKYHTYIPILISHI